MIDWTYGTGDFLVLYLVAGTALFPQMLCEFCLGSPREQGGSWNEEDYPETDLLLFFVIENLLLVLSSWRKTMCDGQRI